MTLILKALLFLLLFIGKECLERRYFTQEPPEKIPGTTTCTDGWLPFEGSCYMFGQTAFDFTEAENFCRQNNSHLIHVESSGENEFIKDHLKQLQLRNWWIGMSDELIEGTWIWFDTKEYVHFSDWYPGQDQTTTEDCAIFWLPLAFKWADYSCLGNFYPICERRGTVCGAQLELVG
ncbi:C-type lectin domain family 17, member A-like [Ruditapes philippinarum]|uniref:C-type lectin domain family 17, member A-like n=1 Tax=Ruditapes philippinarum TaxID=129788 RepID=UPI00295C3822|nr:C-type lectin domain family 17, member A-like [Ruditapes philippinarum]